MGLTASRGSICTPCHITANHPFPFACSLAWSEKKVIKLIITYTNIENRVYITFKELKGECGRICHSTGIEAALKEAIGGVQARLLSFSDFQQPFFRVCETLPLCDSLACFNFTWERCVSNQVESMHLIFTFCSLLTSTQTKSHLETHIFVLSEGNPRAYYLNFTARLLLNLFIVRFGKCL